MYGKFDLSAIARPSLSLILRKCTRSTLLATSSIGYSSLEKGIILLLSLFIDGPSSPAPLYIHPPVFDPKYLSEKIRNVFETVRVGDRIDNHETISFPHVLLSHCAELLLTGRVQYCAYKTNTNINETLW